MRPTVVDVAPRGDEVSCALSGELVVPRLVRRRGRAAEVALVAGRAMLLPGDEVRMRIAVGPGCTLTLVDIGGLVVYGRDGAGEPSGWHARIELAADAHVAWDGLPTVVTDAGDLRRSLTIVLGPGASATCRETLVLGRAGERGGRLRSTTDASDGTGPLLHETLDVSGSDPVPGILGHHRVMDGILALGDRAPVDDVAGATRLDLERGGTLLRHLGEAAHESPLAGLVRVAPPHASSPTPPAERPDRARSLA
ncbi:urease accessory protein UreD [Agromyces sp. SYSU T00194]|uniref:urease accessory protein UreD n=1 Tax=Agromyces chitinivorans TaxID=3158560 RepID=UPI0033924001